MSGGRKDISVNIAGKLGYLCGEFGFLFQIIQGRNTKYFKDLSVNSKTWKFWDGGWVKWVIGIKESTCDEHWGLYGSVESLYCTLETNISVYVN